jgi:hypothetical protein
MFPLGAKINGMELMMSQFQEINFFLSISKQMTSKQLLHIQDIPA